jgi:hypothetical protein
MHYWDSSQEEQQLMLESVDAALKHPSVLAKVRALRCPKYASSNAAKSSSSGQSFTHECCFIPAEGYSLLGQDILEQRGSEGALSPGVWRSLLNKVDELKNSKKLQLINIKLDRSRSIQDQMLCWESVAISGQPQQPRVLLYTLYLSERKQARQQQVKSSATQDWETLGASGTSEAELLLYQTATVQVQFPELNCWSSVRGLQGIVSGDIQPAARARRVPAVPGTGNVSVGGLTTKLQQADIKSQGVPPPAAPR